MRPYISERVAAEYMEAVYQQMHKAERREQNDQRRQNYRRYLVVVFGLHTDRFYIF